MENAAGTFPASGTPLPMSQQPPLSPQIARLLSVPIFVTTTDGRRFHGPLVATDREQNIILSDATESLPPGFKSRRPDKRFRYVGMIVIPGKYIVRVEANKQALEANTLQVQLRSLEPGDIV
ncbi:uncharacterized protein V1518DRAFT_422555 [Limtongia smithiae]|uniref:uncharacterized protein n=1 Tax=Limtongia smithiae TaxID=1125753 RepID=UPI0034CDFB2C